MTDTNHQKTASASGSSNAPRNRGRKLRTPFRRRRGDAQQQVDNERSASNHRKKAEHQDQPAASGPERPDAGRASRRRSRPGAQRAGKTANRGRGRRAPGTEQDQEATQALSYLERAPQT